MPSAVEQQIERRAVLQIGADGDQPVARAAVRIGAAAGPLQDGQRHQQQRRGEDRRDHARGVDLDRQVAAFLLHSARGLALGILDQHPALGALHEADDRGPARPPGTKMPNTRQPAHRAGAAAFEQLGDALRQARDDAGHDDQRHAIADAAAGDLLADPHQEQGSADQADGACDFEQQARLDDRADALLEPIAIRARESRDSPAPG